MTPIAQFMFLLGAALVWWGTLMAAREGRKHLWKVGAFVLLVALYDLTLV